MIYLFASLLILCILSYVVSKKDICSPSFIFSLSFLFSSVWALCFAQYWSLKLHQNTFIVIIGGVLLFIVVSFLVSIAMQHKTVTLMKNVKPNEIIRIDMWKKMIFVFIELFTIFLGLYSVVKAVNGSFSTLPESIYNYRYISTFTDTVIEIPTLANLLITFSGGLGLWVGYVMVNNYLSSKKFDVLLIIIYILSLATTMITGARGGMINILLSTIVVCLIMLKRQNKLKIFNVKFITKILLVGVVVLVSFQFVGNQIGRNSDDYSKTEYLAIYCGASIKNLDLFLQEEHKSEIFGAQTLSSLINWIGPKIGIDTSYEKYLPFRSVNGRNLGNVYTIFMPFIFDLGGMGVILFITIMAIISQYIYEMALRGRKDDIPSSFLILYGYVYTSLAMSFFSNRFYGQIISNQLIYLLLIWIFLDWFMIKLKIKIR